MKRKEFLAAGLGSAALFGLGGFLKAFAEGTANAAVGKALAPWQPGHFQIHAIYTGVAESLFLIYPDGTTLLIDAGDHAAHKRGKLQIPILPSMERHAGEWVSRYVLRVNPQGKKVDRFMLSHYHSDHGGGLAYHAGKSADGSYVKSGLGQVIDYLDFSRAIDRAWPDFNDPLPKNPKEDYSMIGNLRAVYAEMQRRGTKIEKFRLEKGSDQLDPLRGKPTGFSVQPLCANGRILLPDGTVKDLYKPLLSRPNPPRSLNENGMSLGMIFTYGKFRFYTAGDFSDGILVAPKKRIQIENELGKVCGPVNLAKVNHHGHHSMSMGLVRALKAQAYFACMWDQLHMTADTMTRLSSREAYPEERLLCPAVFTKERRIQDAAAPWVKDVPKALYEPKHLVFDVPPGGETFRLSCVRAADESMTVESVIDFKTRT